MLIGLELLAKVLEENDLNTFSKIERRWLLDRAEIQEYDRCLEYLHTYGRLPPRDFLESLEDCRNHPSQFFFEELKTRYKSFRLENIQRAISEKVELDSINSMVASYLFDNVHYSDDGVTTSNHSIQLLQEHIDKVRNNYIQSGLSGLPTGWPTLDNSTGGYDEGGVFVFSGRAKTGKTMLMIYSLNSLLERFPDSKILFLSMEMTTVQVLQRLACLRGHVNPKSLRIGDISSLAERRLIESLGPIADRLVVSEGKLETDIASVIGMIGTTQPLIVFIDGAYLLKTTAPSGALWEKVKEVIETLKRVAINFRVPIVCSYQLKRGSKTNPDLEYLALSDAIGQIASFVMGIIDVDIPNTRKVEIMGVREGVKDSFFINWDWENLDFSERDFTQ